ncbi:hypothetical protein CBE37_04840 [bacterium TMED277]|jgi:hypothetical protein|nr:MAG: hypothetical protein CBE37_04840 [bacterium TMED277]|tara:strand:- start:722 stop:1714 length:993 start_codon:yes stop_codon:yes gene_type:complete
MSSFSTGKYALAISDRSGMAFPYKEMVREWNGSLVHISEFESKHPQLEPRSHRGDAQSLRNARPDRVEPPVPIVLTDNALQAGPTDSEVITITAPGHGYKVGDVIRIDGSVSFFPQYPEVSHLEDTDIGIAAGHTITAVTSNTFDFNPNDQITAWLNANAISGTTTVYIDMDGVLTEYYQAIATYANSVGLLPFGQDWYNLTPAIEIQSLQQGAIDFANLGKRAEADALVDLVISKNGSWAVLSTGPTYNAIKTAWINARYTGARAPVSMDFATNYDKGPFGGANKLLIDDRTTYIDQFEAAGGKGFKYWESGGIKNFGGRNMSITKIST